MDDLTYHGAMGKIRMTLGVLALVGGMGLFLYIAAQIIFHQ